MKPANLPRSRELQVCCRIDVADTWESLHAHVELDGVDIRAGDSVLVHDAPMGVSYGESMVCERTATVVRAGWLRRLWTQLASHFEMTQLFEVGFSPVSPRWASERRRS